MRIANSRVFLRSRIIAPSTWEKEPGYRSELEAMCRRGLLAGGVLAIVGLVLYLTTHLVILGKTPVFSRPGDVVDSQLLVMWDKLLVFLSGFIMLWVYRTRAGLAWGRLAPALIIVVLAAASVYDEVTGARDITSGAVYPTLYLLVAAVASPYRPLQMLTLAVVTYAVIAVAEIWFPSLIPIDGAIKGEFVRQLPYMCISTVVLTGLTVLINSTRYEQHRARMEAERLADELEAHTRDLEKTRDDLEAHARDLEEARRRTEEQAAQLVEAEHLKDRFFGNISHEFRTPLTLIMGPVDDALDGAHGPLEPEIHSMLSTVRESSGRLLNLVNDLLDLSRLDADRVRLHLEEHDLVPFVNTVFHHFVDVASRRRIQLTYHSKVDGLSLSFDPSAIEKVIYNLLSNAFKFVEDGGAIKITLFTEEDSQGHWAKLSVKDNGAGIASKQLPSIWDRFHRLEKEGVSEGTGIGLALVKELVELHGGSVDVRSEEGFGAEFSFRLPLRSDAAAHESTVKLFEVAHAGTDNPADYIGLDELPPDDTRDAPRVMIVDNDSDIRAYVRSVLQSFYRVEEAGDGVEALDLIQRQRPALVISDVMMPRMDGFELCRKIKADQELSDLPVILLTALAEDADQVTGLQAGADDYVAKPFSKAALLARVENLIDLRRKLWLKHTEGRVEPSPVDVPSVDQTFLDRAKAVVEEHMQNTNFGVDWLADEIGLSTRQLQRRIRAITRLTAAAFIKYMRLKRAEQLFRRRAGNVSEVAWKVGYQDAAYFSRLFRQTFGELPSEFIARIASEDGHYVDEVLSGLQEEHDADGGDE